MTAQEEFDKKYITASEIYAELDITRATLVQGRRRGKIPEGIMVYGGHLMIWLRDEVRPHLDKWKAELKARRGYPA